MVGDTAATFNRTLNDAALEVLLPYLRALRPELAASGTVVELRPDDTVKAYLDCGVVFAIARLSSRKPIVAIAGSREREPLGTPERLLEALRTGINVMRRRAADGELAARWRIVRGLATNADADFVALDQEIRLPRALYASDDELAQADLLLVERATGHLWLVELKLADNDELDGPVIDQLARNRALPAATVTADGSCGESAFVAHYAKVASQKVRLELLPPLPRPLSGTVRHAALVVGDRIEAQRRIGCWEAVPEKVSRVTLAIVESDRLPSVTDFRSLEDVHAEARRAELPHAPRRSRHTAFAASEDAFQASWLDTNPAEDHLGASASDLRAYLAQHGIKAHGHVGYPRSSQAACLQVFAPAQRDDPTSRDAIRRVLARPAAALGAELAAVASIDFEVPHAPEACAKPCAAAADQRKLAGESTRGVRTQLDVFVVAHGHREGSPIRIGFGLEFKYTEPEFGCCGGFKSRGFDEAGRRACIGTAPGRERSCYLLIKEGRRYVEDRSAFLADPLSATGPCLLLGPANQLYRGHYTTRALARELGLDETMYGVVHDRRNPELFRPERTIPGCEPFAESAFERYARSLREEWSGRLFTMHTQDVIAAYVAAFAPERPAWLVALAERYGR
jgi:restriction endonuclease-like protein